MDVSPHVDVIKINYHLFATSLRASVLAQEGYGVSKGGRTPTNGTSSPYRY